MKGLRWVVVLMMIMAMATVSDSQQVNRTATILDSEGGVSILFSDGSDVPAEIGMTVSVGDEIITKNDSFALVRIEGRETATVEISANSRVIMSELMSNEADNSQSTLLDLAMGKVLIKADKLHSEKSKFEVKTPTSVVGVRGTTFEVQVEGIE